MQSLINVLAIIIRTSMAATAGGAVAVHNQNATDLAPRSTIELVIGVAVLCTLTLVTIFGNVLVILAIFTYRPLKKVQNFFLISLACADLTVAIVVMPLHISKLISGGKWLFSMIVCQAWITLDILLCTASILNLVAIALDRYAAIHYPHKYADLRTKRFVLASIAVVWTVSTLISVPPLLGWNDWSQASLVESCEYTTELGFVIYSACGSYYIPLIIMCLTYAKIFCTARNRLRSKRMGKVPKDTQAKKPKPPLDDAGAESYPILSHQENNNAATSTPPNGAAAVAVEIECSDYDAGNQKSSSGSGTGAQGGVGPETPVAAASAAGLTVAKIAKKRFASPNLLPKFTKSLRRTLSRNSKRSNSDNNLPSHFKEKEKISISKERRAAKTLAIVMGCFVLCWLPFFTMYVVFGFCSTCIHPKVYEAATWLGYINSCLNPLIYTVFNMDFREGFKRLLCRRRR